MQRVVYENILSESVAFENKDPYVFRSVSGTGSTDIIVSSINGASQDGETTYGLRKERREVDVIFHIEGKDENGHESREAMYTKRRELCGVLAQRKAFNQDTKQRARLFYENDSGRWWTWAVPETGPAFERRIRNFNFDIPLTFRCESPWWYSLTPERTVLAMSGEGFTLPFEFPIVFGSRDFAKTVSNIGHAPAPVEITVEGQGETPSLINHSTGARIRLIAPLPAGYTLYINTDPSRLAVAMTTPEGVTSNAWGLLDPSGPLTAFTLRPGLNDIEYEPGGAAALSRITIQWYALYEGV